MQKQRQIFSYFVTEEKLLFRFLKIRRFGNGLNNRQQKNSVTSWLQLLMVYEKMVNYRPNLPTRYLSQWYNQFWSCFPGLRHRSSWTPQHYQQKLVINLITLSTVFMGSFIYCKWFSILFEVRKIRTFFFFPFASSSILFLVFFFFFFLLAT